MRLLLTAFLSFLILFSGQFQIIDIHQNTKSTIQVTVHGAVLQQGVISLRPYATLEELIAFVGLADDADISSLNLGIVLHDKDVLTIPTKTSLKQTILVAIINNRLCSLLTNFGDL